MESQSHPRMCIFVGWQFAYHRTCVLVYMVYIPTRPQLLRPLVSLVMLSVNTQIMTVGPNSSSSLLDAPRRYSHPITLLPVEILSEIMCYLPLFRGHDAPSIRPLDCDLDPSRRFTKDGPIRTPHWVAVSQVSHRWREIAFACKALWTCIPLVSVRWAQCALRLSHPHPITLHIDSKEVSLDRGYLSVDALCLTLAHMHRIRKIRIHSPWGTKYGDRVMSIISDTLCRGASALEELDLAPDRPFLAYSGPDRSTMTNVVFAELRVLRLDQCYPPADCFWFSPGLTHVQLSGTRPMWQTLESMLSTLHPISELQVLELYGVLPNSSSSPGCSPIKLPSLKELHLGGTGQNILAVLQALVLSESVQVFVTLPHATTTTTETGSPSQWLVKLRAKQSVGPEHAHASH